MARPIRTEPWFGLRNGIWYVFTYNPETRQTLRTSMRTTNRDIAEKRYADSKVVRPAGKTIPWSQWATRMCKRARQNAHGKGRKYALTPQFVHSLMAQQRYRCAVTYMKFSNTNSYRNPFAPSIDQIVPGAGYFEDNVRIVTVIANTAMNGWGEAPLLQMIKDSRSAKRIARLGTLKPKTLQKNEKRNAPLISLKKFGKIITD